MRTGCASVPLIVIARCHGDCAHAAAPYASAAGATTIQGRSKISVFLAEPPFYGPSTFNGTFTFSASLPLGVIALRLGRKLKWDPAAERFVSDQDADRWLAREMRKPWSYDMI